MGHAPQILSVCLRICEVICSAVVVGILGRYQHLVAVANAPNINRLVYSLAIGCISLFVSLVLMIPFIVTFYFFLLDIALFICWMVAFGLMTNVRPLYLPFILCSRHICSSV
jgi:hypothetical protein